jgi:hypothetical protein
MNVLVYKQQVSVIYEQKSEPSLDTESAGALILDFSASRTVSNKSLSFIN